MSDLNQKLLQGFVDSPPITPEEAVFLVRIAEAVANRHQVSKALCGKENATLEEVLQAVNQLKADLEAVKRERDAAVRDLNLATPCDVCMNNKGCPGWPRFNPCQWQWRGECPENTEVQDGNQ